MDNYSVKLMSRAVRDLDGFYDYIVGYLLEPETASKLIDQLVISSVSIRVRGQ